MKAAVQIFLSHAREDEEKVEKLYQKLSAAGFKPWMDKKDILPGERWRDSIRRAIRSSDFVLGCLSAQSVNKRGYLQKEVRLALDIWQEKLDSDIYLIPVRLEDCQVPESLCDFQYVNLFEEDGWTRLVKAIQVGMERRAEASTPIVPESPERAFTSFNEDTMKAVAVQVTVLLESYVQQFTPVERESFIFALSRIVNISSDQIRILRVASGSILVTLEMPEEAAQLLVSMYLARDPVLQTLRIAKVELRPITASPGISRQEVEVGVHQLAEGLLRMYDFTLIFMASDTDYFVRAECSLVGEAGPRVIKRTDLANLSLVGDRLTSGDINDIASAGQIGRALYQIVFQNGLHELFQRALAVVSDRSAGLRTLLKFKQAPELHEIPWELLHNGQQFLVTNPATPIARYLEQTHKVESLEIEPPLRVLFTTACPKDRSSLDLATEERNVRTALEPLGGAVELVVERHVSLDRLRHALMRARNRERPFHVWHHSGHGELLSHNGAVFFGLVLEDRNAAQWVDVAQVSTLVRACSSLRMVALNVCHGGSSAGLGPALASLNVPCVISFRSNILDQMALTFAEAFYEAILYNPVDVALGQARMALLAKDSRSLDWALPLLFLRTTNPVLMAKPEVKRITSSTPAWDTPSGPKIRIKGKSWKARQTKIIGVMTVGDKALPVQSDLQFEFDLQSFETEDLLQIAGLSISSEEAVQHFADLRDLAHSLTDKLLDSDEGQTSP